MNGDKIMHKYISVYNHHSIKGFVQIYVDSFKSEHFRYAMEYAEKKSKDLEKENKHWIDPETSWSHGYETNGNMTWNKIMRFSSEEALDYKMPMGSQFNIVLSRIPNTINE